MSRWFRSARAHNPMVAEEEDAHLLEVEQALIQLLNDDIQGANRILEKADSSYHHLGRGVSSFLASMLGAEKELLKDAAATLQEAENKTWEDMKRAQRESTAFRSNIYPPGTEYLLCYSVAQLTSAICAVLSGSVTQAMGGFYKLRKAYLTLSGIMDIESEYLKKRAGSRRNSLSSRPTHSSHSHANIAPSGGHSSGSVAIGIDEKIELAAASHPNGSSDSLSSPDDLFQTPDSSPLPTPTRVESKLLDIDPADVGITSHTDIFIHSGTRLCFGILLVVFSMINNPIFNKILYIVGFKGDRDRGTRYLWQAARFNNFNSAIAGIALLGFYNGLVGFSDILPTDAGADDDLAFYPKAKCKVLLSDMRKRYPDSKLWKLEEARVHAYSRNLAAAMEILAANSESSMKQIAVINSFELSLTAMSLHDYELCAKSWVQCAELSNWSPTLYAYLTGAAYLEIYRNTMSSDPEASEAHKAKATEYFRKGPPLAGRQKVMSKQLPFDMYIVRKVQKWEERCTAWGVDLADAIGVSPLIEMIYFWGGVKKQNPDELQQSLKILEWDRTGQPEKHQQDVEETTIHALLRACFLRNLSKYEEARELLKTEVLPHDRSLFKGHLKDDWMLPSANYEMACLAWSEKDLEGADHTAKLKDCASWLEKTQKWPEQYVLDTRMSVKTTTSIQTVERHYRIIEGHA